MKIGFSFLLLSTAILGGSPPLPGQTPVATFEVTSATDSVKGNGLTLREAILAANASPGFDEIVFNIPGDGPHSIQLASELPTLTGPVDINGYSQSGAIANTKAITQGVNTVLRIEIDGTNAGTDADGIQIGVGASGSIIRGLAINRIPRFGIFIERASNTRIQGNFIGVDIAGQMAMANGGDGIQLIEGSNNLIGGATPESANVISGNALNGIVLVDNLLPLNRIQGNLIGTDAGGMNAIGNGFAGVLVVEALDTLVGGVNPGEGNLISGNLGNGVVTFGSANGTTIQGNLIGVDKTGAGPLGNLENGVSVNGSGRNTIGGPSMGGNTIGFNGDNGVVVDAISVFTTFLSNSIFSNGSLGIDLGNDGPTVNIDQTEVFGVTNKQNFPILTSMTDLSPGTRITGNLISRTDSDYRIEFFASAQSDPSGFGEGQTFLGFTDVHTDFNGAATFSADVDSLPSGQMFLTATATDTTVRPPRTLPDSHTSEFSSVLGGEAGSLQVTSTADSGEGSLRAAITAANTMGGAQTIEFAIPADDPGHLYYLDDGVAGQVTPASTATTTADDDANIAGIDPDWPHSWWSIAPQSEFDPIADPVVIDGYTQQAGAIAAMENTNPVGQGLNSVLRIEINGGNEVSGFSISSTSKDWLSTGWMVPR